MKKPDLGKESIQRFFLNHTEKLIIALCFAGLVVLAWVGLKFPSFNAETPTGLSAKASVQAMQYISQDNWEAIAPYRKASVDAVAEVQLDQSSRLDVGQFSLPMVGGPLIKIPGLRKLPEIVDPKNPRVLPFTAPVLIKPDRKNSKLDLLAKAGSAAPAAGGEGGLDGARGGNRGGGGDGGGGAAGEAGGRGGGAAAGETAPAESAEPKIPGSSVSGVMAQEIVGVRPGGVVPGTESFLLNMVQVSATVSISEQDGKIREALASARGYFPERDRTWYFMPQLERQEEGSDKWTDITERSLMEIPAQFGTSAPEIAAPEIYSAGITRELPPIAGYDYRKLLAAIAQPLRSLKPPGMFAENNETTPDQQPAASIFSTDNNSTEDEAKSSGTEVQSIESFFGSNMSIYQAAAKLAGKDPAADPATTGDPASRDVLVRVYDLQPPVGKKFRYRLTVWVEDPNNTAEDLKEGTNYFTPQFAGDAKAAAGGSAAGGSGRGGARGGGGAARGSPDAGRGGGNMGNVGGGNSGAAESAAGESNYVLTKIQDEDLSPEARQRLREQRALRRDMYKRGESDPAAKKEIWKTFCIPSKSIETEWTSVDDAGGRSVVALGRVHEPRMNKIGNAEVPRDEPAAEMVGVEWSGILGAWVPGYRTDFFRRGETANFPVEFAHLHNPVDGSVLRLEKGKPETLSLEPELNITTNKMLVDIAGGREISLRSPIPNEWEGQRDHRNWTMPGETLVMDASGRLTVHSEFDDFGEFRNRLFIPDETDTFGRARPVAASTTDENRGSGR